MKTLKITGLMVAAVVLAPAFIAGAHESHGPHVYFVQPAKDATTGSEVKVVMGVTGMQVHAAGELIAGTGHHHLIIDGSFVPKGETVPKDATHRHFGKGQTETTIQLSPGRHALTLQFADGHRGSYGKAMSETVHIMFK